MHCTVCTYWCNLYSNLLFVLAWIFRYCSITSIIAICLIIPVESIAKVNEFMNLKKWTFSIYYIPIPYAQEETTSGNVHLMILIDSFTTEFDHS